MSGPWAQACDGKNAAGASCYSGRAVLHLGQAMISGSLAGQRWQVEFAGANIRAWRKSLPVQGWRWRDILDRTDDELLWLALSCVARARLHPVVAEHNLRYAEAALRTWWKRQEQP